MGDVIQKYKQEVAKRLCKSRAGSFDASKSERMTEAIFFPSFHPEAVLQVWPVEAGSVIRFATMTSSLWYFEQERGVSKNPVAGKPARPLMPPEVVEEVVQVPETTAARFWRKLDKLARRGLKDANPIGVDGMSVVASYQRGEDAISFETWSPDQASAPGKFLRLLCDLARDALKTELSVERLEQLFGYL
ncbi:MAG TPA: hypothetical protein VKI17_01945 [Gemmataceae bacterium]|nr:hypothetical protein [Gemmataceae bacterium]